MSAAPAISVVVVSDYRAGEDKSWDDLRATLAALAGQDFDEPFECLLVENRDDLANLPADVPSAFPGVRVLSSEASGSYGLKNAGIAAARGDLVGVLDADCAPDRSWLRSGVDAMRRWSDAVAISGRTTYPGRSLLERCLALLSRCYVDRGHSGTVRLLSTNNMIVRRSVFTECPLPEGAGPFAYRLLTEGLLRRGGKLYFEPAMRAVHDSEGWAMERDLRRGVGWTSVRIRQLDATLPGAGVVRGLGPFSIPLFYAYRVGESAGHCLRLPRHYGLSWYHAPLLMGLAMVVHGFEISGMLGAFRNDGAGASAYR